MKTRKQQKAERQRAQAGKTGLPFAVKRGFWNNVYVGRLKAVELWEEKSDKHDDAMAEWYQTGFELSLLQSSESPEDYKDMMDEHMANEPAKEAS